MIVSGFSAINAGNPLTIMKRGDHRQTRARSRNRAKNHSPSKAQETGPQTDGSQRADWAGAPSKAEESRPQIDESQRADWAGAPSEAARNQTTAQREPKSRPGTTAVQSRRNGTISRPVHAPRPA